MSLSAVVLQKLFYSLMILRKQAAKPLNARDMVSQLRKCSCEVLLLNGLDVFDPPFLLLALSTSIPSAVNVSISVLGKI
jgi:hypothetical protein